MVAYRGRDNILRVVECKNYLDSSSTPVLVAEGQSKEKPRAQSVGAMVNSIRAVRWVPARIGADCIELVQHSAQKPAS